MKIPVAAYRKFLVALATALAVATPLVADSEVTLSEGVAIASAFVGALAVKRVPNAPQEDQ